MAGSAIPPFSSLALKSKSGMLVLDAIFLTDSGAAHAAPLFPAGALVKEPMPEMTPRWTRATGDSALNRGRGTCCSLPRPLP